MSFLIPDKCVITSSICDLQQLATSNRTKINLVPVRENPRRIHKINEEAKTVLQVAEVWGIV